MIAGPGNAWVQEAKRAVYGLVGIDSLAGPSELMLVAGHDTEPSGRRSTSAPRPSTVPTSPLVVVAVEEHVLDSGRRGDRAPRR